MNENRELKFWFNGKHCAILYDNKQKEFSVAIYEDEKYMFIETIVGLFHVERFSKSQQMTAYHVANRHILTNLI